MEGFADEVLDDAVRGAAMTATIAAELGAAAEAIGSYRERVAALAGGVGRDREDLVSAIHEAERALAVAERAVRRAIKVAAAA